MSKLLTAFLASPQAMYYQPACYVGFEPKLAEDTWHKLELIAVHGGAVKGFMSASIRRETQSIDQIGVVKFCEGHDLEFAADMSKIFGFLRSHFRWLRWSVAAGAPTEAFYHRLVQDQGGEIAGRFKEDFRLRDGRLVDATWFQVSGCFGPDCSTMLPEDWSR